MYESFFGFKEKPFNITPDPKFLYLSKKHREALAHLIYGIKERKGFVVLSGEVGTGKTTLVRALFERFDKNVQIAYVFNPSLSVMDFLRTLCEDFRLHVDGGSRFDYVKKLHAFLLECHHSGKTAALIIDEAQYLDSSLFKEIRVLTNLETSKQKLLQVFLVGQPEVNHLLERPDLRPLKQRISVRHHLLPLDHRETGEYIQTRLRIAGAKSQNCFTEGALQKIYEYSGGVPRLINNICDNSLVTAFAMDKRIVDKKILVECAADLRLVKVQKEPRVKVRRPENIPPRYSLISAWLVTFASLLAVGIFLFNSDKVNAPKELSNPAEILQSISQSGQKTEGAQSLSDPSGPYIFDSSVEEEEQIVQAEPSSLIPTGEEVERFFANYVERYNKKDIQGFLSLFCSNAIQNGRHGFDDIKDTHSNLFSQSKELRFYLQDVRIDIIEIYQNAVVSARCEIVQILKKTEKRRAWKGEIRWVLVRENGALKIRYLDYEPEKSQPGPLRALHDRKLVLSGITSSPVEN
jgi:general secretion pathway protein A